MKRRCRQCDLLRETKAVMKWGGEAYKVGGHWRQASICQPCAAGLLENVSNQTKADLWSVRGLRKAWKL